MSKQAPIRKHFTDAEITKAVDHYGYKDAAWYLSKRKGVSVSRQLVRHWYRDIKGLEANRGKSTKGKNKSPACAQDPSKCNESLCWCKPVPEFVGHEAEVLAVDELHSTAQSGADVRAPVGPRILIIDIETAPIFGAVWGLFNNFVSLDQIKEDWFILSYAAKWVGEDEVIYRDQRSVSPMEDDSVLLREVWELLNEADVVVAHNGRRFDTKKINARFILNGLTPPSPYRINDTLETAKRNFAFTSNKLAYLTEKLTETKKRSHAKFAGYLLWQQCLLGNVEAWDEMRLYNIDDVRSLEELYYVMLPWDDKAPNFGNFVDDETPVCPKCGSTHVELQAKPYRTNVAHYSLFLCTSCHGWSRGRRLLNPLTKRRSLLSPV